MFRILRYALGLAHTVIKFATVEDDRVVVDVRPWKSCGLRFLLARLLLRRLLLLLPRVLLRLRAILLTVHDRCPFIQAGRMKNARTVTDAGIVRVRHNVALDVVSTC